MRILLDECVNAGIRVAFPGHTVATVAEAGWRTVKDGALLELMAGQFDVLVTIDQRLPWQHRIEGRTFGVLLVRLRSNQIAHWTPLFDELREGVLKVRPGEVLTIVAPPGPPVRGV